MQAIILNTAHDRVDPVASRTNLDGVIRTAIIRTTVETALRIHHFWLICRASTMFKTY